MRDFDGTSDYLSFDSTHIDEEAKLAVSVWFEHDTEALERMLVFATTGNKSFMLVTNGETTSEVNFLSTYGHSSRLGADASSRVRGAITLNAKQHFCGTVAATTDYTRDILSAYVNGAAITNTGGTSYYTTGGLSDRLTIAARTNGDSKFDGKIGEIAIWEGYELTLEDSKWLAGGGNPTAITGGTLVHYSRLEGGGGSGGGGGGSGGGGGGGGRR